MCRDEKIVGPRINILVTDVVITIKIGRQVLSMFVHFQLVKNGRNYEDQENYVAIGHESYIQGSKYVFFENL